MSVYWFVYHGSSELQIGSVLWKYHLIAPAYSVPIIRLKLYEMSMLVSTLLSQSCNLFY